MKKRGIKIIISAILFVLALVITFSNEWINNGLFIISYLVVGFEILKKAVRNIFRGKVFDENFLMAVATIGAFAIGEFPEAVAVMLFYQVGELFQSYAVDKSRKSIASLMDIRPDYANIEKDGKIEKVDPDEVKIGDIIIVKTGEKIPLDGVVVEGRSSLDTMALTGESVPRVVKTEDEVLSGCINKDGLLKIRVTKEFGESTVSRILDLVENASNKKLEFSSDNTRVATVNDNGIVEAKGSGNTKITIKTTDGSNISRTINVKVNIKCTSIVTSKEKIEIREDFHYQCHKCNKNYIM